MRAIRTTDTNPSRRSLVAVLGAAALGLTTMAAPAWSSAASAPDDRDMGPVNGGFEEPVVNGEIPGWTQTFGLSGEGTFDVVDSIAYEGNSSLRVTDPDDDVGYGILSDSMPVQAGHTYEMSFQAYVQQGTPSIYVYFYDEDGTELNSEAEHFRATPDEEWTKVAINATAPEGAVSSSILLYSLGAEVSTYYADQLQLTHTGTPPEVTDLGVAMYTANVRLGKTDVLPDGTRVAYMFSNGSPLSLTVTDLRTGEVLDTHEFEDHKMISSATVADDHMLYFSGRNPSPGSLWRYDPVDQSVEQLLDGPAGETAVNDLLVDGDTVYGSTYPNAKVWAYDTSADELRDFGSITDEGDYARRMTMVDGNLWVGTSTNPQLLELDTETGELNERELPPDMEGTADFFSGLSTHGDLVFAKYKPSGEANSSVYDITTGEWQLLADSTGWWTEETNNGSFYYAAGDTVKAFDIDSRESRSIGWEKSALVGEYEGTSRMAIVDLGTDEFPGSTLVGIRTDGHVWRYNLQTQSGDVVSSTIEGAPATVRSAGVGADGSVYFGAYLSSGVMSRVDHRTGELEQISGPKQADSIVAHGDRTVVGTYPNAGFYAGDADREWDWGNNPEELFSIGRDNGQDRPMTMVSAGPVVAAGTIPNYGELGGALVLFDADSGEHEVHRNVVQDQSVTSLAYRDGMVYGGTSIHGGLDSEPSQDEAELFVWDSEDGEVVTSSVVVDGAEIIHSLAFDSAGRLWGMADEGTLFEYDPETHEVVRSFDTGLRNSSSWGTTSEMYQNPADGLMYGNAGSRLFQFDPESLDFTVLVRDGVRYSAVDDSGTIYFADETNVFRLEAGRDEPVCDETVTGEHGGRLVVTAGTTCLHGADVAGPVRVREGASIVVLNSTMRLFDTDGAANVTVRDSEVNGPVWVTGSTGAVVLAGNTISGPLRCSGNAEVPTDDGDPNTVNGPSRGQCADL